jgi:hypothetical protein
VTADTDDGEVSIIGDSIVRPPQAARPESCETTPDIGDSSLESFPESFKVLERPGVESESDDSDDRALPCAAALAPGDFMGAGFPDTSDLLERVVGAISLNTEARGKGAITDNVLEEKRICMHDEVGGALA